VLELIIGTAMGKHLDVWPSRIGEYELGTPRKMTSPTATVRGSLPLSGVRAEVYACA
jgi:hypothetical protein